MFVMPTDIQKIAILSYSILTIFSCSWPLWNGRCYSA